MRAFTYILLFLTIIFCVNVFSFVFIDDYRFLLRKIKYPEMTVYVNPIDITDNYWVVEIKDSNKKDILISEIKINNDLEDKKDVSQEVKSPEKIDRDLIESHKLSEEERKVLDLFKSYSLTESELPNNLFWLVFDYSNKFWKYYSNDLEIYFFWKIRYDELKKLFTSRSQELQIEVNEVNNFWDRSFYVNWDPFLIKIIFEKNWYTYSFEILKSEYENIKKILNSL